MEIYMCPLHTNLTIKHKLKLTDKLKLLVGMRGWEGRRRAKVGTKLGSMTIRKNNHYSRENINIYHSASKTLRMSRSSSNHSHSSRKSIHG